jgi:DNA-binding CsgD family transcriptional regulator
VARSVQQQVESREREAKAVRLRSAGLSYALIADELGLRNAGSAYKAFRRGIQRLGSEEASEALSLAHERYLALLRSVWSSALEGDQDAVTSALEILDRIERLFGFDEKTCRSCQKRMVSH